MDPREPAWYPRHLIHSYNDLYPAGSASEKSAVLPFFYFHFYYTPLCSGDKNIDSSTEINRPEITCATRLLYLRFSGQQPGTWFVADQTLTEGVTSQMVTGEDGLFRLIGLDTGSYTLKETTTPGGYNTCEDVNVTVTASHGESISTDSADLDLGSSQLNYTIVNESGSELPSTGGPGPELFRLPGLLMILGAGVMLISRRAHSNHSN